MANLTGFKPFVSNEMVFTVKGFGKTTPRSSQRYKHYNCYESQLPGTNFQLAENTAGYSDGTNITRSHATIGRLLQGSTVYVYVYVSPRQAVCSIIL